MIALARFGIALALSISAFAVFPQQPPSQSSLAEIRSAMLGDWVITYFNPGSGRARLSITNVSQNSDGSFQITGMYADGDNPMVVLKRGELTQSGSTSQLYLTTNSSVLVAKSQGEGGFRGDTFKMEKAEAPSVAAAAAAQDSVNTPGMAEVRQAIERNPVKRPFVEVGDCWAYRWTSASDKDAFGDVVVNYTSCVTYVDYSKNVIMAVNSRGGDGIDLTYTTEWNLVANSHVIHPSRTRFLKFPLHIGDTYSFDGDYQIIDSGKPQTGTMRWNMKVVGWEDVTVPAGKFRAMRIEGAGSNRGSERRVTIWYVPEVNREVKSIWTRKSGTDAYELTQTRLNK